MSADFILDPFLSQWDLDSIPACDEGMALLKVFAERSPALYDRAAEVNFDPAPSQEFEGNPYWQAFMAHWAHCDKCNEV